MCTYLAGGGRRCRGSARRIGLLLGIIARVRYTVLSDRQDQRGSGSPRLDHVNRGCLCRALANILNFFAVDLRVVEQV